MKIGIDASRAFVKSKTGIEEYSYRVIEGLTNYLRDDPVVLYLDPRVNRLEYIDFELPKNWQTKFLRAPLFWTQARLSLEMFFRPVDTLFVPAHTVPLVHPARNTSRFQKIMIWLFASLRLLDSEAIKTHSDAGGPRNTIVTIHGLEYEFCPKAYSWFERLYMRWSIRKSCRWAKRVIAVSKNTKKDLIKLYGVPEKKIDVIYEGYRNDNFKFQISNFKSNPNDKIQNYRDYFLFVGRLEERKNIAGIVEAFEILKEKYKIPHKLILVGKYGFGGEKIKDRVYGSGHKSDIILTGYMSDEEKYYLLANADVFLFPTFYEGFGLPILEAQNAGTPVITSNISSMPEVAGDSAVLVDPKDADAIAEAAYKLISDESYKNDIIQKGYENVKRFSWEKCARGVSILLRN